MKLDNLFLIESPLQALVALELSLMFSKLKSGVIYRVFGGERERSDQQIQNVLKLGNWAHISSVSFDNKKGMARHFVVRDIVLNLSSSFKNEVDTLYFGEFRSHWMHLARGVVGAQKDVLMDDGTVTVIIKEQYLDNRVYYPSDRFNSGNWLKNKIKRLIYRGIEAELDATKPVNLASAFVSQESSIKIDYSNVRRAYLSTNVEQSSEYVFFFGSKYSEAGIVSRTYELEFVERVKSFYSARKSMLIYCAHRDESDEKIEILRSRYGLHVIRPDLPAELYILNIYNSVTEVAAAYSSVLNNINLMFPAIAMRSFKLEYDQITLEHRDNISNLYSFYVSKGIKVETEF